MKTFTIKPLEWKQEQSRPWLHHCTSSISPVSFTINTRDEVKLIDWNLGKHNELFGSIEEAKARAQAVHDEKLLMFLNETETYAQQRTRYTPVTP